MQAQFDSGIDTAVKHRPYHLKCELLVFELVSEQQIEINYTQFI